MTPLTLVNHTAPNFTANAVMPNGEINDQFNFQAYTQGSPCVLFFWPLDFTFVCPTEIIAHDKAMKEFEARGVKVIGISIDSHYTHAAWRNTPINQGGIGPVQFPMVADIKHEIMHAYGIAHSEAGVALRASFLIDKNGVVQHQTVNNLPLGRSVNEMLRTVDALQHVEQHGEVCPANWKQGEDAMTPSTTGVAEYQAKNLAETTA